MKTTQIVLDQMILVVLNISLWQGRKLPAAMFGIMEGLLTQKSTTNGRGYAK